MKTSDFYYELPPELIAQTPVEPRDSSRMMVYNKQTKEIELKHFYDIVDYLSSNDIWFLIEVKLFLQEYMGTGRGVLVKL